MDPHCCAFAIAHQSGDPLIEQYLPSGGDDALPHGGNDGGQFVGADVGVGVHEDVQVSAVLHHPTEHFFPTPALLGAGVKFAVRIGARSPFTKAVIRIWVDGAFADQLDQVPATRPDLFASFHYNRPQAQLDQPQCAVQTRRP